jgi:tripartite-type tricarboxylate transporter receptor subunit TctC
LKRLLAAALLVATPAAAQYPDRPIRFIVPQAAGSATDNVVRLLAPEMAKQLNQQVIVENRPGGALTIGIEATAKAAPDGYTIGMGPVGAMAITRHMVAKLPYDIERDLQPIALVSRGHILLAVSPASAIRTVQDLIDQAKRNPGKLTNASSSNGSPGHVAGELFKYMTGTQIVHVPYKGGAMAINDLIAGHVQVMWESVNSMGPHVRSGRVRAIGIGSPRRSAGFPDVPTIAEAGVPGYEATTWSGVIAPAGLPRPTVDKLNAAVNAAIRTPIFKERFEANGDESGGGTPEEFAELIRKDSLRWADVVKRSGARID